MREANKKRELQLSDLVCPACKARGTLIEFVAIDGWGAMNYRYDVENGVAIEDEFNTMEQELRDDVRMLQCEECSFWENQTTPVKAVDLARRNQHPQKVLDQIHRKILREEKIQNRAHRARIAIQETTPEGEELGEKPE